MTFQIFKAARVAGLAIALAVAVAAVHAQPQPPKVDDIVDQQKSLRAEVAAGKGAFKDLSRSERDVLMRKQDNVLALLAGRHSLDELRPDEKTSVLNDLEWIKAAVTKAEDERLVCEYTRTVGSNRPKSVCMTAKQQREHRENAKKSLRTPMKCDGALSCKGG